MSSQGPALPPFLVSLTGLCYVCVGRSKRAQAPVAPLLSDLDLKASIRLYFPVASIMTVQVTEYHFVPLYCS